MTRRTSLSGRAWALPSGVVRRPAARPLVRVMTRVHSRLHRVTGGAAQSGSYPTLLLTVPGRKSGALRTTPLVYLQDGADFFVAAAYSGAETDPVWWLNLQAASSATVQVRKRSARVRPHELEGRERDEAWQRLCRMYPPFLDYERRTTRRFPVVRLVATD